MLGTAIVMVVVVVVVVVVMIDCWGSESAEVEERHAQPGGRVPSH